MLFGLRFNAFTGGDNEQHGIHATGAGKHITDEQFVSRHIDKADSKRCVVFGYAIKRRKAKVDSYAAPLLLGQTIAVNASKCANQCRFAMVDMTGCSDDDGFDWYNHRRESFEEPAAA